MKNLDSRFQINDEVTFRPMFEHQQRYGISDQQMEGKIVAIRFTESKVFYDILDNSFAYLFRDVISDKVLKLSFESHKLIKEDVHSN